MEITWLKNEDNAIQYVYASAVPQKIPLDIFKEIVQSSKENCLPEFYVISEQGKYIGYILLLADKKEDIPKPFTFLACHNGDTLPKETHKKILEFIGKRCRVNNWNKRLVGRTRNPAIVISSFFKLSLYKNSLKT